MKCDQLNKHEERSYIQDAEANEAILKNTVSKDELCKFLTPLKFLEIQTWRKEVPFGDTIDEAEVEHRRWRTPIEILLPTAGRDDEGNDSFYDGINGSSKDDSSGRRKSTSTNGKRRKFFEDVRKQNAEMLQRTPTDATKPDANKPVLQTTDSSDPKSNPAQSPRNTIGTLRTAYAPANPIPPYKDGRTLIKKSRQTYVNRLLSQLNNSGAANSSFPPAKPVLSRIRGNNNQSGMAGSKQRPVTSGDIYPSYNVVPDSGIKGNRIQSSSWPGINLANRIRHDADDDVQVLPLHSSRPQTVGNEVTTNHTPFNQRHMKVRVTHRARGWRHWNTKRVGIESTFSAATRLYQNSLLPKRSHPIRSFDRGRNNNRSAFNAREISLQNERPQTTKESLTNQADSPQQELAIRRRSRIHRTRGASDHVTKISYALNRPNEIKVRTLQGPKQRETMSRVTPIPPIEMALSRNENIPIGGVLYSETGDGMNYLTPNGIIALNHVQAGKSNTPWVAEAFTPAMAADEDYFSRQQRHNKSVTFRLGAT